MVQTKRGVADVGRLTVGVVMYTETAAADIARRRISWFGCIYMYLESADKGKNESTCSSIV